ncbi:MAG TPA: hypothetical protein VM054_09750 [bacterium]|nr:hypothetical protein [bacterium]
MRRYSLWVVAAVLLALPLGVRCESDSESGEASLAVTNGTYYYIHVQIGSDSFPYLPPGETSGRSLMSVGERVTCRVTYSPGQGVSGWYTFDYTGGGGTTGGLGCNESGQLTCEPTSSYGSDDVVTVYDVNLRGVQVE